MSDTDEVEATKFFLTQPQLDGVNIKIDRIIEKAKEYAGKETQRAFIDTALLKKEVENDEAEQKLSAKKEEFDSKMEQFKVRRNRLRKAQNDLREKCERFKRYIDENESKRMRAVQKYKRELLMTENKKSEHEGLVVLYRIDESRYNKLKQKVLENEIYRDFLNRTLNIMPAEFFLEGERDIGGIISRYNTLKETNEFLLQNSVEIGNKLEREKFKFDEMRKSHENMKMTMMSKINCFQNEYYVQKEVNDDFLLKLSRRNSMERDRQVLVGKTFMVINSLAESCASFQGDSSEAGKLETYVEKLAYIENFILEKSLLLQLATIPTLNSKFDKKLKNPK